METFTLNESNIDQLACVLCTAVKNYMSRNHLVRLPNRIAFMVSPDTGICHLFLLGPKLSRMLGSIKFQTIEQQYYDISGTSDSTAFENEHAKLIDTVRKQIRSALNKSPELAQLNSTLLDHSLEMTSIEYADMETEEPLIL
jgi:hypothetical protein